MKIFTNIAFIVFYLYVNSGACQTLSTANFDVLQAHLEKADDNTLVVFDINEVLFQPQDQILQQQNTNYRHILKNKTKQRLYRSQMDELTSIIFLERNLIPIDPRLPKLITTLQQRGIKVIALTNCFTGPRGRIASMERWRHQELQRIGYDFSRAFPDLAPLTFKTIAKSTESVTYEDGVIFTSGESKGEAITAFLKYSQIMPAKIIFVDDKMSNIKSVEQSLYEYDTNDSHSIEFTGIEFTAARSTDHPPLNTQRADYQFRILEREHRWLSDSEADQRMVERE